MNPLKKPADPLGIANSLRKANEYWLSNGVEFMGTLLKLVSDLQSVGWDDFVPLLLDFTNLHKYEDDFDAAFLDLVKKYSMLMQRTHAAFGTWLKEYVCRPEPLDDKDKQCSAFWLGQFINSISPSNWFWTNPVAVQKFLRSEGRSLITGYENWAEDFQRGDCLVKISDTDEFKIGENIATTPGYVVFRNKLMELIQYSPTTETTFTVPIVLVQPWINKYYILDLTEEKSLISYLVNQGFTVFVTSWKNPSSEMRNVTFDDYMIKGALKAVEVAKEICGAEQVHAAGYCIGGTVLTALMAWLNAGPPQNGSFPIRDFTLFASLVDYTSPGELGVYINDDSIAMLEQLMKKKGYLDKSYIAAGFRLLRSKELIWRYYSHNYLQGEIPPKSEFLYWNSDSTRLPASMASFYLREFYLNNKLIKENELKIANRPLDLRKIERPLYVVGAEQDHICPWQETLKITNYVKGPAKFVLTTEGHITGIVNPPSKRSKRKYWTGDITEPVDPEEWVLNQRELTGSWWTHWAQWLSRDSSRGEPPSMGSSKYCTLEKAPGSYVKQQ